MESIQIETAAAYYLSSEGAATMICTARLNTDIDTDLANGVPLALYSSAYTTPRLNQSFIFCKSTLGDHVIICSATTLALTDPGTETEPVICIKGNGTDNQRWKILQAENGTRVIQNVGTGNVLSVKWGEFKDGTDIICSRQSLPSSLSQQWRMCRVGQ